MGIFDLFGSRKHKEVSAPRENREDLGEDMELVNVHLSDTLHILSYKMAQHQA